MSFETDPIESATTGAVKGGLEWSTEKLKEIVAKFKNRQINFIGDNETIDIAKEQRVTPEWKLFSQYVMDKKLRVLFQMGLTLRKMETQNKQNALELLKKKILNKYDTDGLHIAQLVQNGSFSRYMGNIVEKASTQQTVTFEIENLFAHIENTVAFIQTDDDPIKKAKQIITKILAHTPKTFIICSSGSAMNRCEEIKEYVITEISEYEVESYNSPNKRIYFLNRKVTTL